jgi:hypothetical protein
MRQELPLESGDKAQAEAVDIVAEYFDAAFDYFSKHIADFHPSNNSELVVAFATLAAQEAARRTK